MRITYLGHSAFEIVSGESTILIDPYLICSPSYNFRNVTNIFLTHGHGDHLGNSINISKATGAEITAVFELANYCAKFGVNTRGINLGGWIKFPFGKVIFVPTFHSSSTPDGIYAGCASGIIFEIEGKRIFHTGDTSLNAEMKAIKEAYKPDAVMIPIGGTYTMDVENAAIASEWIGANTVIPMHYNTFDAINADVEEFKNLILQQGKNPQIMKPNDCIEL